MNVLSLFDGMSCGQIALNRAGIAYDRYYASEVDRQAIVVTQRNYPETIQLGDAVGVYGVDLPGIDLLIGGSPCTGFSFAGRQLNFEDPRSKLFFEFARLVKECNPKFWLLENVIMKKEYENVISETLGVKPVLINSALVSAQNRKRLYWANFGIEQPNDLSINLVDVIDDTGMMNGAAIRGVNINRATMIRGGLNDAGTMVDCDKSARFVQCLEVRPIDSRKSGCLTTVPKDNVLTSLPPGRYVDAFKRKLPFRYYTPKEYCRLQTVPEDYFDGAASKTSALKMLGNGWTVDVIAHIFRGLSKENCE